MTGSSGFTPTIGIIGGGQLGRMLVRKAGQLGFDTVVLDPTPNSPAGQLAGSQLVAELDDAKALETLARSVDITTYEIEHIAIEPLKRLRDEGVVLHPDPAVLGLIQDKLAQKRFFAEHDLPTSRFVAMDSPSAEAVASFGALAVQKARFGGYDGRGVLVLGKRPRDSDLLPGPSLLEEYVDCAMEIAVVVARGVDDDACAYPVVEMHFDDANVLDVLVAPARIEADLATRAQRLAMTTVRALGGVGVFGVEIFLSTQGQLLINEVAPRVHNSGHFSIEACRTCQFEQHLRAISKLPLGSTHQHSAAVMVNILGSPGSEGSVRVEGLAKCLAIPGLSLHMYAKQASRPGRKMGHLTVVDSDLNVALARAYEAKAVFKVMGDTRT